MLVAWGRWQSEADTLGKATRLDGGLCLADIAGKDGKWAARAGIL